MSLKSRAINFLMSLGIGVTGGSNLMKLRRNEILYNSYQSKFELIEFIDEELISELDAKEFSYALRNSTSQLGQDLLALVYSGYKREGFFVEFGATNGKDLSNSFMLERYFEWKGILAEPAMSWHRDLKFNRKCAIETDCVWKESNIRLVFNEVTSLELSTIDSFSSDDMHVDARKSGKKYFVNSISLNDLLRKHDAPYVIDYLSIDTEGSEYEILSNFDFNQYQINFISCEHNFTETREQIHELLKMKGYVRVLKEISNFDDWYVLQSLIKPK